MSTPVNPNTRTDFEALLRHIKERFLNLNFVFADYSNPTTNRWQLEKEEYRRLSTRFQTWYSRYPPSNAGIHYELYGMMSKKRELLKLMNKLFDATTICKRSLFPMYLRRARRDRPLTICLTLLVYTSKDAETQVRIYRPQPAPVGNPPRGLAVAQSDIQMPSTFCR